MTRNALTISLFALLLPLAATAQSSPSVTAAEALEASPIIDGHNDLPWQIRERHEGVARELDIRKDQSALVPPLHTDIPRLRAGGVGGQFWSVYVPSTTDEAQAVVDTLEQIDIVHQLVALYPDTFELARTSADVRRIMREGRIASLIGIEGGHSIASSLPVLRRMHDAGARYMTLTHSKNVPWADSATDAPAHGGLTDLGREVVREMNRLGMLVDLSHTSPETMHDVLDIVTAPVIFSHSSARAVTNTPRNVPDDVLRRLKEKDGVVMVTFVPSFVSEEMRIWYSEYEAADARTKTLFQGQPERAAAARQTWRDGNPPPKVTVGDVADHVDHIREVAGIAHIGIGGDFDGISATPEGLDDVSTYPALLEELARRGYSEADLRAITGQNILRVMEKAEAAAAALQAAER